ncbi:MULTISPECIES: hypothetical protein [unclassified Nonomuraea]|uniref:hypothetical protein n=1 Tax=unclassified Nonomuraea TaxID=2593643 RepID=UPI0033DFB0C6
MRAANHGIRHVEDGRIDRRVRGMTPYPQRRDGVGNRRAVFGWGRKTILSSMVEEKIVSKVYVIGVGMTKFEKPGRRKPRWPRSPVPGR